jgi:stage II sporulation protein E
MQGQVESSRQDRKGVRKMMKRRRFDSTALRSLWNESRFGEGLLFMGLAFVVTRAVFFQRIHPFGIPFWAAAFMPGQWGLNLCVAAGTLFSMFTLGKSMLFVEYLLVIVVLFMLLPNLIKEKQENPVSKGVLVFVVSFILKLGINIFFYASSYVVLFGILESMLAGLLTLALTYSVSIVRNYKFADALDNEDVISVALIAGALVAGVSSFRLFSIPIGNIVCAFLVMTFALIGGSGIGAGAGVILGLVLSVVQGFVNPLFPGLYGVAGLLAGAFRKFDKIGVIFGFVIGNFLFYSQVESGQVIGELLRDLGLSLPVFFLIPTTYSRAIASRVAGTEEQLKRESRYQMKLRSLMSERLLEISKIFSELSKTFYQTPQFYRQSRRSSVVSMLDQVTQRACEGCTSFGTCWEDNFHRTYNDLLNTLVQTETAGSIAVQDVQKYFQNRCIQSNKLVTIINFLFEIHAVEKYWQKRVSESREIVSSQLSGVAEIMTNLSDELKVDIHFGEEIEERIITQLDEVGIVIRDVNVICRSDSDMSINISKPTCLGLKECEKVIAPVISSILGKGYAVWSTVCGETTGERRCTLRFQPAKLFDIETRVAKMPKEGSVLSGDSQCVIELPDAKTAVILSDGMGSGPNAALESEAVIGNLRQLLQAGFDRDFAIRTVNSILILKSPEDSFATIDVAILDLVSANAEFVKVGASPSFIIRDDEVLVVQGKSLPVGILNTVDIDTSKVVLQDGDILVMATDGIIESPRRVASKEEWVSNMLRTIESGDPDVIANTLLRRAIESTGGVAVDDLTVVATKITMQKDAGRHMKYMERARLKREVS